MKYAFMTFSTPEMELAPVLALARELGYDGIEVRVSAGHKHGLEPDATPEQRTAACDAVRATGVPICCVATSCRFADPAIREGLVQQALQCIDLAADVGAGCIRVFGGQLPEGTAREAAVEQVAEALGRLAGRARERGVAVCMETHDDWCDPHHVAAVMQKVDDPAIAVNWDIMHPVRRGGATMDEAFEILKPWIRHVHFHDGKPGEGLCLIGQGDIDHRRAVELLQGLGYDGYLSGEWINRGPHEDYLAAELATMRGYEA
ncbi:MAG: sugar phosphate isomerase/epimerase [Candidatus Brocadiaceae bacterium]|nr:sugar phosphate isomerase/epimerase [Candidatus Brocadiaceae bacterium]